MGFTTGAKTTRNILEEIVNSLITTGVWYNVDTTWSSATIVQDNNCRRILTYGTTGDAGRGNSVLSEIISINTKVLTVNDITNFAINDKIVVGTDNTSEVRIISSILGNQITVDANFNTAHAISETVKALNFEIYMAIEIINQVSGMNYYGPTWYYGKGFRFVFSASWDAVAHTYPTSNQSSFIPFESHYNGVVSADLLGVMVTYWMWIEDNGNGFIIMGVPEPTSDSNQQSFIIVVERNATKEYADGYTNFFLYKACNIYPQLYDGTNTTSIWRDRQLLRPFAFQWSDDTPKNTTFANGYGISFIPTPSYYAFKSNGDNKVYYVKPLIHNLAGQITPIFQSNLFFPWSEGVGLIDGDIIAIEGQTTKFLCKSLSSPDSTNRITYAIKYVV
jgi:hypothetical protein